MYNTLAKCGMKIPREVAISSPRSGGEAVVGAVKQLSNDSENLTRRHTGETLGLAAIPPPFQLLAVGALPGRPYDRSARLSHAQLPLLDAKRANSPQRISAANSPRPSVTIPAAEVPYAIGADRR